MAKVPKQQQPIALTEDAYERVRDATLHYEGIAKSAPDDQSAKRPSTEIGARFRLLRKAEQGKASLGALLDWDANRNVWFETTKKEVLHFLPGAEKQQLLPAGAEVTAIKYPGKGYFIISAGFWGFNADKVPLDDTNVPPEALRKLVPYGVYVAAASGTSDLEGVFALRRIEQAGWDYSLDDGGTICFLGNIANEGQQNIKTRKPDDVIGNDPDQEYEFVTKPKGSPKQVRLYHVNPGTPAWVAYTLNNPVFENFGLTPVTGHPRIDEIWGIPFFDPDIRRDDPDYGGVRLGRAELKVTAFWWRFVPTQPIESTTTPSTTTSDAPATTPEIPDPTWWIAPNEWWRSGIVDFTDPGVGFGKGFSNVILDSKIDTISGVDVIGYAFGTWAYNTGSRFRSASVGWSNQFWNSAFANRDYNTNSVENAWYWGYGWAWGFQDGFGSQKFGIIDDFAPVPNVILANAEYNGWYGTIERVGVFGYLTWKRGWRVMNVDEDRQIVFIRGHYQHEFDVDIVHKFASDFELGVPGNTLPPDESTEAPTTTPNITTTSATTTPAPTTTSPGLTDSGGTTGFPTTTS